MKLVSKKYIIVLSILLAIIIFGIAHLFNSHSLILKENNEEMEYNLFFPNVPESKKPRDLLVMVFLYNDNSAQDDYINSFYSMSDQEIQIKYYNEIFGSGDVLSQTWSVNDFYKENSNGDFYFNPIVLDDNETGIYPIRLNKVYNKNW